METRKQTFSNFHDFWPFYLSQHRNSYCRLAHFIGSWAALSMLLFSIVFGSFAAFFFGILTGYGFAWIGHFVFEKNRPATFSYPVYSFYGDWKMFWMTLTRKLEKELKKLPE